MRDSPTIRSATAADLAAINDIYNYYVAHSTCTYQEEPESLESRREWFAPHDEKHPVIVAELNGEIVGWGSLSPFHARSAYRRTVENSIYVQHQHQRQGIGSLLLENLIAHARQIGCHAMIAGIDAEQKGSIALHTNFHFERVGHLRQVGFKMGRWLDVIYLELMLEPKWASENFPNKNS